MLCNSYSVVKEKPAYIQTMTTENSAIFTPLESDGTYVIYPCDINTWHDIKAQEATISPAACDGATLRPESSIVCEEIYEELNLEKEESCVTIIISDTCTTSGNDETSLGAPATNVTLSSVASDSAIHVQRSLRECLKLASSHGTEACCFLCPETYTSFTDLKKHFIAAHNLTQTIAQLTHVPSEYILLVAKEIKNLKCSCTTFICTTCKGNFSDILKLMQHVLLDHPATFGSFPFFTEQQYSDARICQQCTILKKLCHIDYDLFVKVLLDCRDCLDENCELLLKSWPLADCSEPCTWCAEEVEPEEARHSELTDGTPTVKREVVCYKIKQALKKCSKKGKASTCICPILKCPECPKTVANYADLCRHIRLSCHSTWHDMKILWDKYKIIKENCPVCPKYSYHCYILCPHCPHQTFESEKAAQAHMDSQHKAQTRNETVLACTCPNYYVCLKCSTSYPTPQSLYCHLQLMQHSTEENLAAIPAMIQRSIKSREGCPRCALEDSSNTPSLYQEEECSCKWVECSICKISFRKVSSLRDHKDRDKHVMSATDIRKEKQKLASSVKTCHRCCSEVEKYCMLCHERETFLHTHLRTRHQDCQIMLLRNNSGTYLEEVHTSGWDKGRQARYECSVCLLRFSFFNKLRHHVRQQHPHCYFTLLCLDLSNDVLQVKDFAAHEELMVLNVISKR